MTTGRLDSEHEGFRHFVLEHQHEGESALVRGDVEPRLRMWSHHDPVTLFAAVGPTKAGWRDLEPTFRAVAARLSGGRNVRYELIAFDVSGDVAWSAGVARFEVSMDGAPVVPLVIRLTHAYRREDGVWKVVHEHSDFQPPDHAVPIVEDVAGVVPGDAPHNGR
jgi:ketosteroid isomerase-like protein